MQFPNAIVGWNGATVRGFDSQHHMVSAYFPGVRVHPTPIYEAILYTLIFLFLWSRRKETKVPGQLFYLYLILAGAARFMVEFLRINARVFIGLSEAQIIAFIMMVVGVTLFLITARRVPEAAKHTDAPEPKPEKQAVRA
jgi:phosphatidylglycerol:prolipoprotein diacylglycerol transferase